jgi:LacI family transcriptional regulator
MPFVFINRRVMGIDADWVHIDDFAAAAEACALLVRSGRQRIAILGGPSESSASRARAAGALDVLRQAGLEPVGADVSPGELSRESGRARVTDLLDGPDVPDAIVCGNDMIALGVMDVCHERGVRIPEDLSIVGFDDMSFASAGPLQLTTVSVPRQAMGERAAELLFERIEGYDGSAREVCLPHRLQVRSTVAPPVR